MSSFEIPPIWWLIGPNSSASHVCLETVIVDKFIAIPQRATHPNLNDVRGLVALSSDL